MNDFLHKLRNGNGYRNSNNDTRFNKKRRQNDNGQGVVYDRRVPKEESRRKNPNLPLQTEQGPVQPVEEALYVIKDLLMEISGKQERLALAEERKAGALEAIVGQLQSEKGISLNLAGEMAGGRNILMREKRKRRAKKFEDPDRKRVMQIIASMRKDNETYQDIADRLEKEDLKTFSGRGKWHAQTVHRLCQD